MRVCVYYIHTVNTQTQIAMTLPDERYRSIKQTRDFLWRLAGGEIPRVPKAVRQDAHYLLRHYPSDWELERLAAAAPDVVSKTMEPLHRMILQHEESLKGEEEQ